MLKPLATLFLLFTLFTSVNAQVLSVNQITEPAVVTSVGAFAPGVIIGTAVTVTDAVGSTCPNVTYEWMSSTNEEFTENVKHNLASTKDYNPGTVMSTTYFRRTVKVACTQPNRAAETRTGSILITIH